MINRFSTHEDHTLLQIVKISVYKHQNNFTASTEWSWFLRFGGGLRSQFLRFRGGLRSKGIEREGKGKNERVKHRGMARGVGSRLACLVGGTQKTTTEESLPISSRLRHSSSRSVSPPKQKHSRSRQKHSLRIMAPCSDLFSSY